MLPVFTVHIICRPSRLQSGSSPGREVVAAVGSVGDTGVTSVVAGGQVVACGVVGRGVVGAAVGGGVLCWHAAQHGSRPNTGTQSAGSGRQATGERCTTPP